MVRDSERQFLAAIRNLYFFRNTHRRIYFKGISSCIGTIRRQIFLHISSHTRTRDYAVCSKRQGRREMENTEKQKTPKELKSWEKEKKLIGARRLCFWRACRSFPYPSWRFQNTQKRSSPSIGANTPRWATLF